MIVRTRFAPSPTGFLHIGGLRTALFCWLYARRHGGQFILRIEDTDLERSTEAAIQQILDGMEWAGLIQDEGPFFQTKRFERYKEVIEEMLAEGTAYRCYCTKEELEQMRAQQTARGEKPRYDGRWRERTDSLPGAPFVVRFKNPLTGEVVVDDVVHGPVVFQNSELDDLIIARSDGTPTYNFCVVVDDLDMQITHVIRGDDHVNNTPRQINILRALGGEVPVYAHLPTVLNEQGEKMSKRHGAMSVMGYRDAGFLPEAVLNYLARLGWSHGDAEIFSREQFVEWFNLDHLGTSPAQYDPDRLKWLNAHYIKEADNARLETLTKPFLAELDIDAAMLEEGPPLELVIGLLKDRASTVKEIAENAAMFYQEPVIDPAAFAQHV